MIGNQCYGVALPVRPGSPTTAMNEHLVTARIVVVQHKVDFWNVQPTCCYVSYNQNSIISSSETIEGICPLVHIHFAIYSKTAVHLSYQTQQILNVIPSGHEDNNFFSLDNFGEQIKQNCCFFLGSDYEKVYFHGFG